MERVGTLRGQRRLGVYAEDTGVHRESGGEMQVTGWSVSGWSQWGWGCLSPRWGAHQEEQMGEKVGPGMDVWTFLDGN